MENQGDSSIRVEQGVRRQKVHRGLDGSPIRWDQNLNEIDEVHELSLVCSLGVPFLSEETILELRIILLVPKFGEDYVLGVGVRVKILFHFSFEDV